MKTTDLWFASFLLLKDYKLIDYKQLDYDKLEFEFNVNDEELKKLKLEFNGSYDIKMKYEQEKLKDLRYRK